MPKPYEEAVYDFNVQSVDSLSKMQMKYAGKVEIDLALDAITPELGDELLTLLNNQKKEIEETRAHEKKNKIKEIRQFPDLALVIKVHDAMGQNAIRFSSKNYRVFINREFYHWLETNSREGRFTYKIE